MVSPKKLGGSGGFRASPDHEDSCEFSRRFKVHQMSATRGEFRVMHVITGLGRGGAENQLAALLRANVPSVGRVMVISLLPGGAHRASLENAGILVHDLGMARGVPGAVALWRLAGLIRRYRPHILHAWLYHAQLLATLGLGISGRWRRTRLIWGVRCSDLDFAHYGRSMRWVARFCGWLSSWPDAALFNSEAGVAAHRELGFRPRRTELLDNGIDTERFRPDPSLRSQVRAELAIAPTAALIAHVARVDPMKDHATFLAAIDKLDLAEALLIGTGTERLSAPSNVHALGPRDDVERLLAAADLIVSSSAFGEGFSNALAEGMASGLPAVATDVGDSARIVGRTGCIVPPREPGLLAEAMDTLLRESKIARATRGAAARRRIEEHFSIARATEAHRAFYASLF